MTVPVPVSRRKFYKALLDTLSEEDTRKVCSIDLGIDYDSLPGEGKAAKARELMAYFERRERNGELIAALSIERPHLLKFDTGRLGPLLRVDGEMPNPQEHQREFLASLGQRSVGAEYIGKLALAVLIGIFILQLAVAINAAF